MKKQNKEFLRNLRLMYIPNKKLAPLLLPINKQISILKKGGERDFDYGKKFIYTYYFTRKKEGRKPRIG